MIVVYYPLSPFPCCGLQTSMAADWAASASNCLGLDEPSTCVWLVPGTED